MGKGKKFEFLILNKVVPSEGLEPPCLAALGSKPSVSANSTNWAQTKTDKQLYQKKLKKQKLLFGNEFFIFRSAH